MNTKGKIAIALAVMMVAAAMVVPAVMGGDESVAYSATVCSGQDTSISDVTGAFGAVEKGSTGNEITGSFNLTNSGDWDANIDAKFLNHSGSTYGMTNATETLVIPGDKFYLDLDGAGGIALKTTDDDTLIGTVTKGATMICDAILDVPSSQAADTYTGTVLLTFSNAP